METSRISILLSYDFSLITSLVCRMGDFLTNYAFTTSIDPWSAEEVRSGTKFALGPLDHGHGS